jgi:hypothetical protein
MAGNKKTRLSDDDILVLINQKSRESVGWYDSRLSRERERVLDYKNGKRPARQHPGSSSYVSTDVYDAVQMMKAQLLEVFAGGDQIAQFDPDQDMGIEECRIATEWARYVIFRENNGYKIFGDVIDDGLSARAGLIKVFWEEKSDLQEEEVHNQPYEAIQGLVAQDDVDSADLTADDENAPQGTYSGTITRKADASGIRILQVPPEEFLIEPRAITLDRATYKGQRTLKTKAELIDMGLDKDKVAGVHYDDSKGLDLSPEVLSRNAPVESLQALNNPIQPELEQVMLYESYVKLDLHDEKGVRLYKALHTSDVMFEIEEVECHPFIPFVPLPIPHLFYGENFAARVIPIQNARTVLFRAVLDHAAISTNPRWGVVKGGLLNPREMIDNRLGGLVNVARPDSVFPLPVNNLNPFVFEILSTLTEDNEKSTGISSLSQGLNKDAISSQNSQGLVGDLVSLSSTRQKVIARNFAYNFFVPLMIEVMRLTALYEKKEKVIEVAGDWVPVDPSYWTARRGCSVSMHLGYGEGDAHAQKIMAAYKGMAEDPALQNMFTPQNKYTMIRDAMKAGKLTNGSAYITSPDKAQPVQPDPLKVKELGIKDKTATAALITAQGTVAKDQATAQSDAQRTHLDQQKIALQAIDHDRTSDRQDLDVANRVQIAQREMKLEENMRPRELKGIVSPNG